VHCLFSRCYGASGEDNGTIVAPKGADVLVTEVILSDDLVAVYKRSGIWQSKTPAEQAGNIRHLEEEHITPDVVGKMAAKAGVKAVLMTHLVAMSTPMMTTNATSSAYAAKGEPGAVRG
jgi:ribonuclease BN (tRNA processing enzyme)